MAFILRIAERFPLGFAVGYGGAKTIAADALVQTYMERREEWDVKRLMVFLSFGFFQVGAVQYGLYVGLCGRLFPGARAFSAMPWRAKLQDPQGMKNLAKQVSLDMLIYHPFCYFPVFYTCKEIIQGDAIGPIDSVQRAITRYIPNALDDLVALWKIFVPVSIIQMGFLPMHLRVPFCATAGFIWCGILSIMRGGEHPKSAMPAENKVKALKDSEGQQGLMVGNLLTTPRVALQCQKDSVKAGGDH